MFDLAKVSSLSYFLQLSSLNLCIILSGGAGGVTEWRAPQGRQVAAATTNTRQVCVALNSGELVYFELDLNGVLQVGCIRSLHED